MSESRLEAEPRRSRQQFRLLRVLVTVAAAAALVSAVAACGTSGRELRDPPPGATAPPRVPPAVGERADTPTTFASFFALSSDAWTPGEEIPERHSCEGADVSPPLVLSQIPPDAVELAIVVDNPDAGGFVHWVLAGIDPTTVTVPEGSAPPGAVQTANGFGRSGWAGPCPEPGTGLHTYDFTLHALSAPSGVTPDTDPAAAIDAIEQVTISRAVLTGTFER